MDHQTHTTDANAILNDMSSQLENLLNEFYTTLSNSRKKDIESLLNNFAQQDDSWDNCLKILPATQNQYVMMFCLSVLERTINRKWVTMGPVKGQIRQSLWKCLLNPELRYSYIRKKTAKLVVDIGRFDWPHFYPDFLTDIFCLVNAPETTFIGLVILQTAIEELTQPRDDLAMCRKAELHKLLLHQIPQILSVLTTIMERTLDKHVLCATTATPPPSPTHHSQSSYNGNGSSLGSSSDILSNAFELSLQRGLLHSSPSMDIEALNISTECLNCVALIFAWLPLNHFNQIENSLLAAVFVFATFGCSNQGKRGQGDDSAMQSTIDTSQLGNLAMNCINEILSKNCISSGDSTDFLFQLFLNTFHLLQSLIKENNGETGLFSNMDEDYIQKFTEFLRLFVSSHFPRFENYATFPVVEFLALLFHYTFKHSSCDRLVACLEIWNFFLDYILMKKKQRDEKSANETVAKYKTVLTSLASEITFKIQHKYNASALEYLDNGDVGSDLQTEWSSFLKQCIEAVAKISDILPNETFEIVNKLFDENVNIYLELRYYIAGDNQGNAVKLQLPHSVDELNKIHCSMRDCSVSLQLLGRLSPVLTHEHFASRYADTKSILEKLIHNVTFSNMNCLYTLDVPQALADSLIECHEQLFATLKAFNYWMAQASSETRQDKHREYVAIVTSVLDSCVEVLAGERGKQYPSRVTHSSILCLLSIANTVRPRLMMTLNSMQRLCTKIMGSVRDSQPVFTGGNSLLTLSLSTEDELMLLEVVSKTLLLPWYNVSDAEQEWNSRSQHHDMFISSLLKALQSVASEAKTSADEGRLKVLLKRNLPLLSHLVNAHCDSSTRSKQLLFRSIGDGLGIALNYLSTYLQEPEIGEELLNFLLVVFDVLRSQVRLELIEETVGIILKVFRESSATGPASSQGGIVDSRLLEKFFRLLTFVVQQPASVLKSLIPGMLSLVLHQISPLIMQGSTVPDVLNSFFEFLYQFLFNNFKYFFKHNVLHTMSNSSDPSDGIENEADFLLIMSIYGQSFCQPDINLFKQNLLALENLNFRLKLYHKHTFRKDLLRQFLLLFMQTFVYKSHNILLDEVTSVIYNMASVDFESFYREFTPVFLNRFEDLDPNQKSVLATNFMKNAAHDLPSFSLNLQQFANDLRYYKLCNSAIVPGQQNSTF